VEAKFNTFGGGFLGDTSKEKISLGEEKEGKKKKKRRRRRDPL